MTTSATTQPLPTSVAPGEHILQFFAYAHLPPHLAQVSMHFGLLADRIVAELPRNPERTVALRKLLEAKDRGRPRAGREAVILCTCRPNAICPICKARL